jgi:signal transduction histidine kinase
LSAANFQYATFLKVDLQDPPFFFIAVEALVLTMICLCFALLIYGIHKKEKILLAKLALVLDSFDSVGSLFSTSNGQDEFEVISKNIDQLSTSLKEKTLKISEYKESFERKTKLEQLGLTVSQVGHDLRAPLSEAKNFIDALPLLIDRAPREELQKSLLSVSKRLGSGVDSLDKALRFTEVQATPKEDIFLLELVGEVISRVRLNPKMAEIKITVDRGKFDEVVIRGERSEIESVVFNLIQNSWEERRDANIRIAIESLDSGRVRIFFRDDGTGIPDELLEKVFEPLVTFKNNGTGIGLYSCRETLLRHSGTIRANSSRNGAEFEIVMPFRESPCMN